MSKNIHISGRHDVMSLVNQYEFEPIWVVIRQPCTSCQTLNRGDSDICNTGGVSIRHFDLDCLVRVQVQAVARCLLDKLPPVSKDESLGRIGRGRWDLGYQVTEDDLNNWSVVEFECSQYCLPSCHYQWPAKLPAVSHLWRCTPGQTECSPVGMAGVALSVAAPAIFAMMRRNA